MFQRLQKKKCSNCCFVPGAAAAWSKWRSFWKHRVFIEIFWGFSTINVDPIFSWLVFPIKDSEIYIDIWFNDILRVYYFLAILETKKSCLIILSFLEYFTLPIRCFSWLILDSSKSSWPSHWTQNWQVTFLNMPERPGIFWCTQVWRSHEASSSSKFFDEKQWCTLFQNLTS